MRKLRRMNHDEDGAVKVRGFFRLQIVEGDPSHPKRIVGDSGWRKNTVTNEGFDDYLCRLLAHTDSSKYVSYVALGTGTDAINVTSTALQGENQGSTKRVAVTVSVSNSKTLRFTATFNSTYSFVSTQMTLRNIGLFDNNATNGTLFAASTYPTSTCDTNQNVNVTYDIVFSQT